MNWFVWNILVAFGRAVMLIAGLSLLMGAGYGLIGLVVWLKSRKIPLVQ